MGNQRFSVSAFAFMKLLALSEKSALESVISLLARSMLVRLNDSSVCLYCCDSTPMYWFIFCFLRDCLMYFHANLLANSLVNSLVNPLCIFVTYIANICGVRIGFSRELKCEFNCEYP